MVINRIRKLAKIKIYDKFNKKSMLKKNIESGFAKV